MISEFGMPFENLGGDARIRTCGALVRRSMGKRVDGACDSMRVDRRAARTAACGGCARGAAEASNVERGAAETARADPLHTLSGGPSTTSLGEVTNGRGRLRNAIERAID